MPVPVIIVTGFLGGGKTTLLRRLLPFCREGGVKPALIINEVGDADVDGELLADLYAEQMTLVGGCVCCTLQARLSDAVHEIVEGGAYDLIILECSGLSNPLDVLSVLSTPALVSQVAVSHCLCVVDAARIEVMLKAAELARTQIATADLLVLNKLDRLPAERLPEIEALARSAAPHAELVTATYGYLDDALCRRLLTDRAPTRAACTCGHAHDGHHHHHHELPESFFTVAVPLPELPAAADAAALLAALPESVIRAKGFIHCADGGWHVLHRVYDAVDVTPFPRVTPAAGALLICIGQHLDAAAIKAAVEHTITITSV